MIENVSLAIDPKDVLVVRKLSGWEYDKQKLNLDDEKLKEWYMENKQDYERMFSSHLLQMESIRKVALIIGKDTPILTVDDINHQVINKAKLVVVLGGDNFFQQVSHFVHTPVMLGINSDPEKSEAEALPFTDDTFIRIWPKLQYGDYQVEKWVRLEASVNGQPIPYLASSEVALVSSHPFGMSRYRVEYRNQKQEFKNSGIVAGSGLGSTGWLHSISSSSHQEGPIFSKSEELAYFHVREKYYSRLLDQSFDEGFLERGEILQVTWLHHLPGLLGIDPNPYEEFAYLNKLVTRGDVVKVKISDHSLNIVMKG